MSGIQIDAQDYGIMSLSPATWLLTPDGVMEKSDTPGGNLSSEVLTTGKLPVSLLKKGQKYLLNASR